MPAKAIDARLSRLEAQTARGRVVVCQCATQAGRRNLPPGEHFPDCPALTARGRDVVLRVKYSEPSPTTLAILPL